MRKRKREGERYRGGRGTKGTQDVTLLNDGHLTEKNIRSQCYRPCSFIIFILKARTFSSTKSSHFSVLVINDHEIAVQFQGHVALFICVYGSRNRS